MIINLNSNWTAVAKIKQMHAVSIVKSLKTANADEFIDLSKQRILDQISSNGTGLGDSIVLDQDGQFFRFDIIGIRKDENDFISGYFIQ